MVAVASLLQLISCDVTNAIILTFLPSQFSPSLPPSLPHLRRSCNVIMSSRDSKLRLSRRCNQHSIVYVKRVLCTRVVFRCRTFLLLTTKTLGKCYIYVSYLCILCRVRFVQKALGGAGVLPLPFPLFPSSSLFSPPLPPFPLHSPSPSSLPSHFPPFPYK